MKEHFGCIPKTYKRIKNAEKKIRSYNIINYSRMNKLKIDA